MKDATVSKFRSTELGEECGQGFSRFYFLNKISQDYLHSTRLHDVYISAISHLITLKLKSDFSSNLCFTVLFINLKPHLSFKQLSDLTRSGDLRTVKRVFVSDRMLGTKPLMKALMRGSGNFQIQICFSVRKTFYHLTSAKIKCKFSKKFLKKFREIGSDFGLKFGYNLQCSTCNIQIHLLLSQCCL